jgi:acyl-CoA synthetase (AMP-forming)/AMP-acid ligase II
MLLLDDLFRITARRYPNNTSTVYQEERFTFKETDERINRLANALLDIGVKKGDRVAMMQTDCHQFVETDFAVSRIGAVYVPLNYRLREAELEYLLNDSGSTVFFVGKRYTSEALAELLVLYGERAHLSRVDNGLFCRVWLCFIW